ncbi:general stress protein [Amycolatopsis sp. NPDC049159]|uniref:general stress protein n=1 Tax=Amycolatopsis sp. NPDC049159 TaxID=3157210 RepID=UPI0033C6C03C
MNTTSGWTRSHRFPAPPAIERVSLGSYPTYAEAQSVVEQLAKARFELETTQIVGTDLRLVEQVTGPLTWARALVAGMASGAWFGLFVGLLLSIVADTTLLRALSWGIGWGLVFGAVFAVIGYGMTRGRRDFTSRSATVPTRFDVLVETAHADHARAALAGGPR